MSLFSAIPSPSLYADDSRLELPVPLTLGFAIQEGTRSTHPAMLAADAGINLASADLASADSNYDFESEVELTAGYVIPNDTALNQSRDDNQASIRARKVLYDFGVTADRVGSAQGAIDASRMEYELARQRQVIEVVRHYFDVLLADLKYAWDNEAMAMEYVEYDKTLERYALKQVSDVELLQRESDYQVARTRRNASETMLRTSRALLAVAMDRPGELSTDLAEPELATGMDALADLEQLVARATSQNMTLRSLRKRESAAKLGLEAASHQFRPTLDATLEAFDYSRDTPSKDDLRARINLTIPLNESGAQRSEVARNRAAWLQASADALRYESQLRNEVAGLWAEIQRLQTRQQELDVSTARAEIEFDKARGEYALERRATLGDAMVNISRMKYQQARNRYQLALAMMQMNLLTGGNPETIIVSGTDTGGAVQ